MHDSLQQLVRGTIRELINEVNNSKIQQSQNQQSKRKKRQQNTQKRTRYISSSVRVDVLKRDNYRCVFCGRTSKSVELQIDHIVPFSKGGSNKIDNLQTLCIDCNLGKSDRF